MKKTRWLTAGILAMCALMGFTACKPGGGNDDGPDGPGGSQGDSYVDYDPNKPSGGDSFDYEGNYSNPELTIDGKGDDEQWQNTPTLLTYGRNNAVSVKIYRGQEALFFLFDVKDTVLLTQGVTNDDAVTRGDSIELYIDTKADGGRAPQSDDFQINLGIHGKTRIMQGSGSNWGSWNGLIDYEVDLNGTLNDGEAATDVGYTVEVMVRYRDIMIERDDTIGIAFGQVDKWGVADYPAGGNTWDWFGWTYAGSLVEPQTIDNYILLDKDNNLLTRDEQPKPDATIAGSVKDADGNPVAGATATIRGEDVEKTATTDAQGYFAVADIPSNDSYSVTVEKSGYLTASASYTRAELRAANGGIVLKEFTLASEASLTYTTLTGTVKNVANGAVGGATVSVKNTTLTVAADADGSFTIGSVPANNGDITLVVSKTGYADSETTFSEETLVADGTTALGDVNLNLPWANMGMFAGKSNFFVAASATLTRTLTGIQIHFEGLHRLSGRIEVYVDTKESLTNRNDDSTAWCFNLNDDGTVTGAHYQGTFTTAGLVWSIEHNDSDGFIGDFFMPYGYFPINALEVFGIEFGQWSTSASDWDGWTTCPVGQAPVAENPTSWVRVGATNNLYRAENNNTTAAFSGNVGAANITVTANGVSTTSGANGAWSMNVPVTSAAVTVTYSGRGYVTKTTTIEAGYFDSHLSWSETVTLEEQKVTITGKVTDQDGKEIAGVDVTLVYDGLEDGLSVKTNASGEYTIDNITTFRSVTITFSLEGYASGTESFTADALAAQATHTLNKQLTAESNIQLIAVKGKVTDIFGDLEGATVTVVGHDELTATTDTDGTFKIESFPAVDNVLTVEKDGYMVGMLTFSASAWTSGDYEFTALYLTKEYEALGGAFGTRDVHAHFVPYVTRGEDAFEFKFVGTAAFNGNIEFFVDTGISGTTADSRDASDYRFDLGASGTIGVENWGGPKQGVIDTLALNVAGTAEAPEVYFTLPYAYLGVTRTEIIGVTFGHIANGDWDGWNAPDMPGVNGEAFVAPEITMDYIRVGLDNKPFSSPENKTLEELDLTGYNLHFGSNLDPFHAKVSRDETGVTFEFVTAYDFGTSRNTVDGIDNSTEVILIYLDVDGVREGGWSNDYVLKIASDGNVYLRDGAWWAVSNDNKIGEVQFDKQNGITRFTYKLEYTRVGLDRQKEFGFSMVEGWLTAADQKAAGNSYGKFLVTLSGGHHVAGDAADEGTFIRIDENGTLSRP